MKFLGTAFLTEHLQWLLLFHVKKTNKKRYMFFISNTDIGNTRLNFDPI